MTDITRLKQDAEYVIERDADPVAVRVAQGFLTVVKHPGLVVPEGWALVKRPELKDKGVPAWRPWT